MTDLIVFQVYTINKEIQLNAKDVSGVTDTTKVKTVKITTRQISHIAEQLETNSLIFRAHKKKEEFEIFEIL